MDELMAYNNELGTEAEDNVEVLESKMTSAMGLMTRILGEAFQAMKNK